MFAKPQSLLLNLWCSFQTRRRLKTCLLWVGRWQCMKKKENCSRVQSTGWYKNYFQWNCPKKHQANSKRTFHGNWSKLRVYNCFFLSVGFLIKFNNCSKSSNIHILGLLSTFKYLNLKTKLKSCQ